MKKMRKKVCKTLTVALAILISGILSGCATSSQEIRTTGDYGQWSSPVQASFQKNRVGSIPVDPALQKSLPEMTAEEYEASGDLYFGHEDYTMAFAQYEKSLGLKPGNVRIYFKQGMLFLYVGKREEAVNSFQKVLEKDPDWAAAHEGIGIAFFEMRQFEEAEKYFLKAVELDRTLWKARNYLGNIWETSMIFKENTMRLPGSMPKPFS